MEQVNGFIDLEGRQYVLSSVKDTSGKQKAKAQESCVRIYGHKLGKSRRKTNKTRAETSVTRTQTIKNGARISKNRKDSEIIKTI